MSELELDANIKPLVIALNQLPGVFTFSSCGGHKNPKPFQNKEGHWYVCFELEGAEGLGSLGALMTVLDEAGLWPEVKIELWPNPGASFQMESKTVSIIETMKVIGVQGDGNKRDRTIGGVRSIGKTYIVGGIAPVSPPHIVIQRTRGSKRSATTVE